MKKPECAELSNMVENLLKQNLEDNSDGPTDPTERLDEIGNLHNVICFFSHGEDVKFSDYVTDAVDFANEAMWLENYATKVGYMVFFFGASEGGVSYNFFGAAEDEEGLIDEVTGAIGVVIGDTKSKITERTAKRAGLKFEVIELTKLDDEDLVGLPRTEK